MRALVVITGWLWAAVLGEAGLLLWSRRGEFGEAGRSSLRLLIQFGAVLCMSGATFIFMVLVADELCPRAWPVFTSMLKTTAGMVVWVSIVMVGWLILRPII